MGERCNHEWLATGGKPVECITCGARRSRRLIGWRVTWRKVVRGEWEPRQMLYTLAATEHARSFALCAADVMRGAHDISEVRVWRVYRRRAGGGA